MTDPLTPLLWIFGFWLQTGSPAPLAPTTPLSSKSLAEEEAGAQSVTPGGLSLPIGALDGAPATATGTACFSHPLCPPGWEWGFLPLPGPPPGTLPAGSWELEFGAVPGVCVPPPACRGTSPDSGPEIPPASPNKLPGKEELWERAGNVLGVRTVRESEGAAGRGPRGRRPGVGGRG